MQEQGTEEEQAAFRSGASGLQTFFRVTLPNIKWALLYGVILANARAMGEFGAVAVVSGHHPRQDQHAAAARRAALQRLRFRRRVCGRVAAGHVGPGHAGAQDGRRMESGTRLPGGRRERVTHAQPTHPHRGPQAGSRAPVARGVDSPRRQCGQRPDHIAIARNSAVRTTRKLESQTHEHRSRTHLENVRRLQGPRRRQPENQRRRAGRPARSLGLGQDDAAADHRGPRGAGSASRGRHSLSRRGRLQPRRQAAPRGVCVPALRAVPPHDGV